MTSLFLPALKSSSVLLAGTHLGYLCFAGSLVGISSFLSGQFRDMYVALLGICNILMMLSPILILIYRKGMLVQRAMFIGAALSVCIARFLLSNNNAEFRVGYYIWCLSFILLAVAVNIRVVRLP